MKDSKSNVKRRRRVGWVIGILIAAASISVLLGGFQFLRGKTNQFVEQTPKNARPGLMSMFSLLGLSMQVSLAGIEHVLLQGEEQDRLLVIDQLGEIDLAAMEDFPSSIYTAIEKNLEHENDEIRVKAERLLSLIQSSPWYESRR